MRRWCITLNYIVFLICFVNGVAWFEIAVVIGGDARGGKIEHGKYYLEYKGQFTEVSPETYRYSKVHGMVTLATIPLAAVCMVFIALSQRHAPSEVFRPDRRAWAFMLIGGAIGLSIGILAMMAVPHLFDSRAIRLPWSFIPEGLLFGLMVGAGLADVLRSRNREPARDVPGNRGVR